MIFKASQCILIAFRLLIGRFDCSTLMTLFSDYVAYFEIKYVDCYLYMIEIHIDKFTFSNVISAEYTYFVK